MTTGHFRMGTSDQRCIQAHFSLIRNQFEWILFWFFVLFYRAMLALPRGRKKQRSDYRHIYILMSLIRTKRVQLIEHASPLQKIFV